MQRWQAEWRRIEERIEGLKTAASMANAAAGLERQGMAHEGLWNRRRPTVIDIVRTLRDFLTAYGDALPMPALNALQQGLALIDPIGGSTLPSWQSVLSVICELIGLRAEVSASLHDPEVSGRHAVEVAFEHLSRTIMVDDDVRQRWGAAYGGKNASGSMSTAEVACERLGALHLLGHKIFAFKSDALGERTDLILQDRLAITRPIEAADALVLTEWKVAKASADVEVKAHEARRQAARYSASSLAATELASTRYIVVVTGLREHMPDDIQEGPHTYRHINVAVSPEVPSKEARRLKSRTS